jgi:hypothetical protein
MAKKKKKEKPLPASREERYNSIPEKKLNPTHKEDFDNVLKMLVPQVKPKGIKSDKMLED